MPTISLDVDVSTAARVTAAFGKLRGLTTPGTPAVLAADGVTVVTPAVPPAPRSATLAEVKAEIRAYVAGVVQDQETAAARAALAAPAAVTIV